MRERRNASHGSDGRRLHRGEGREHSLLQARAQKCFLAHETGQALAKLDNESEGNP